MNSPVVCAWVSWLPQETVFPALIGIGAGLVAVLAVHFLIRGGQPVEPPPPEQPQGDHDPFVQGSASEQRSSHRRTGNPVEILIRQPDSRSKPVRGWVLDRSLHGLGLAMAEQRFGPGSVLEVRPANAPAVAPWVEVEVQNSRQRDGQWHLGCKFVRTPPWALLLMFG
ncbi:MAG: PilZ domain-containing protein [Gemmataceae bacterium]|nr:PilZ domain-containing protein [Gemmataceae bacterium]